MTRPPYLAGAAIVALFAVGVVVTREGDTLTIASETSSPWATAATVPDSLATGNAPAEVESGTEIVAPSTTTGPPSHDGGAVVDTPAERRQNFVQVTATVVPPPVDGDCESWRPLLERYGIPYDEARPIMWRESNCSMAYNYNASTADDSYGLLQVNRYGSLAAWWDEGGYTAEVMATPEGAVAAAAVLYHSCRWSPWHRPYGCDGDYLQTPEPKWSEW